MLFSERLGIERDEFSLQINTMDARLRNALWNFVEEYICDGKDYFRHNKPEFIEKVKFFWTIISAEKHRNIPDYLSSILLQLSKDFDNLRYNSAYDVIEAVIGKFGIREGAVDTLNFSLGFCGCGYRLIGDSFVPITTDSDIEALDEALSLSDGYHGVQKHLRSALQHLSNRDRPDYRNSIKESVSALESVARCLAPTKSNKFSDSMQQLDSRARLHGSFKKIFVNIYGYASDEEGIRHSIVENDNADEAEARFMFVACSAAVSYLIKRYAIEVPA